MAAAAHAMRACATASCGSRVPARGRGRAGRAGRAARASARGSPASSDTQVVSDAARDDARRDSRRAALSGLFMTALGSSSLALSGDRAFAATMPDSEPVGLDARGRLRRCPSTFNCVSTSSIGGAPEQFATAWTAPTATLTDAVNQITAAVFRAVPDARKVDFFTTDGGDEYLRFEMGGKLGVDAVEFLIRNEGVGDRGWEGDAGSEKDWLVTYRSLATTVKYVYPFMTPVSDFGEQKKRMERIRREVEWRRVGCELEECENDF
jgi:uncharacterized protein (DUF1499 family)